MKAKGNILAGVLIIAFGAVLLAICSSTAIHEFIIETVAGP